MIFYFPIQICTNFDDMIGKNAGNCLHNQRKYFDRIVGNQNEKAAKALIDADNCDVISVLEENVQEKSVKAKDRLEKLQRKFAQCYMQSGWIDYEFINGLKTNKVLSISNQNAVSFDIINREIDDCVEKSGKFIVIFTQFYFSPQLNLSLHSSYPATIACSLPSLHIHEPNVS